MKAAVVEAFKEPLKIWNEWPDPELGLDDVLVKVKANGICRSDWHLWQGHWDWMGFSPPLPVVLGHESAGVVEEVGANVKRFKKGDRVVFPFGQACGHCGTCAQGDQHVCENLSMSRFRGPEVSASTPLWPRVPVHDGLPRNHRPGQGGSR